MYVMWERAAEGTTKTMYNLGAPRKIGLPAWLSPQKSLSISTEADDNDDDDLPGKGPYPTSVTLDNISPPSPVNGLHSVVKGSIMREKKKANVISPSGKPAEKQTETESDHDDNSSSQQLSSITTSLDSNPAQHEQIPADLDGFIQATSISESVNSSIYIAEEEPFLRRRQKHKEPSEGLEKVSDKSDTPKDNDGSGSNMEDEDTKSFHRAKLRDELRDLLRSNIATAALEDKSFQYELIQLLKNTVAEQQRNEGTKKSETKMNLWLLLLVLVALLVLLRVSSPNADIEDELDTNDGDLEFVLKVIEYETGV